jgi:hypothetical protein
MPEINIKTTVSDAQLKKGFAESVGTIRSWGKEAAKVFKETQSPMERYAQDLARVEKLFKDGYVSADIYHRKVAQLNTQLHAKLAGGGGGGGRGFQDVLGSMGPVGGLAAGILSNPITGVAAAAGAAFFAVKSLAGAMDDLADRAENIGVSMTSFMQLEVAAVRNGSSIDAVGNAIQKMTKNIGEAAQGTGKAAEVFASLGLSVSELEGLTPDQAFVKVADAISQIENRYARAAAQTAIFGKTGAELDRTLAGVRDGLGGISVPTESSAKSLAELGQAFDEAKLHARNFFAELAGGAIGGENIKGLVSVWGAGLDYIAKKAIENTVGASAKPIILTKEEAAEKKAKDRADRRDESASRMAADAKAIADKDAEKVVTPLQNVQEMRAKLEAKPDRSDAENVAIEAIKKEEERLRVLEKQRETEKENLELKREQAAESKKAADEGNRIAEAEQRKAADKLTQTLKTKADKLTQTLKTQKDFEDSMRRELEAKPGESSRDAQLRKLMEGGYDPGEDVLANMAGIDAKDAVSKFKYSRPSAGSWGSQAANDLLAKSPMDTKEARAAMIAEESKKHLARLVDLTVEVKTALKGIGVAPQN